MITSCALSWHSRLAPDALRVVHNELFLTLSASHRSACTRALLLQIDSSTKSATTMGRLNWPTLSRERPKDVFEHANALEDDFKALHEHVKTLKASKRHLAKLPSGYTSKISKGISQGVTEAIDNEYYPKFISDIDRDLFCKTLLQAIRSELATEAHDRIPLLEFDTLHSSYKELVKKLTTDLALNSRKRNITPDSDPEQNRGNSSRQPTSHTINQAATRGFENGEDDVDLEIDEEAHDILRTLQTIENQGTILSHQLEFLEGDAEDQDVHGTDAADSDEEEPVQAEESEKERNAMNNREEGPESVQVEEQEEEREDHDSAIMSYGARNANAVDEFSYLRDDKRSANAMRGFGRDERPRITKEYTQKEETRNTQIGATFNNGFAAAYSKLVTFEIKHQATVNRLTLATSQEILDRLYRSLKKIIATQENLADLIHLSEPRLVDDGDVMFRADTDSIDLFSPAPINAWEAKFEADISPRVPTFQLALTKIEIDSMDIATRRSKADVIHKLIGHNKDRFSSLHGNSDIVDLSWPPHSDRKRVTSLLIEFTNRQLANEVLRRGLAWQGGIHRCHMIYAASRVIRCSRCQAYGHQKERCSAPYRCGKCAEAHPTKECASVIKRCAACSGRHQAKSSKCPVKMAEVGKFRFPSPEPVIENGNGDPVTVPLDFGSAGAVEERILPSSTSGLAVSPNNAGVEGEQLRLAKCGKCQGYGHVAGKCSNRLRCGKCALRHFTWTCKSTFARCAVCNGDHMASSALCPARPLEEGRSQQPQESEMSHMPPLRTAIPAPYPPEPEIKIEPQSPTLGPVASPKRTPKKRSMLAQVEELIQVVSKSNSREMTFIKDHLETLESAMRAEGGDIMPTTPRAGKRRAQEALMSGALQDHSGSAKRIKVEGYVDPTVYDFQL